MSLLVYEYWFVLTIIWIFRPSLQQAIKAFHLHTYASKLTEERAKEQEFSSLSHRYQEERAGKEELLPSIQNVTSSSLTTQEGFLLQPIIIAVTLKDVEREGVHFEQMYNLITICMVMICMKRKMLFLNLVGFGGVLPKVYLLLLRNCMAAVELDIQYSLF